MKLLWTFLILFRFHSLLLHGHGSQDSEHIHENEGELNVVERPPDSYVNDDRLGGIDGHNAGTSAGNGITLATNDSEHTLHIPFNGQEDTHSKAHDGSNLGKSEYELGMSSVGSHEDVFQENETTHQSRDGTDAMGNASTSEIKDVKLTPMSTIDQDESIDSLENDPGPSTSFIPAGSLCHSRIQTTDCSNEEESLPNDPGGQASSEGTKESTIFSEKPSTSAVHAPQHSVDPDTMDMDNLDSRFRSLDVEIDGIPSRIYIVNPWESITKVLYNGKVVWTADTQEVTCMYCMQYMENGKPQIMSIMRKIQGDLNQVFRKYKEESGWFSCCCKKSWQPFENVAEINTLRVNQDQPTKFTLNISKLEDDSPNYQLLKYKQDGIITVFHVAKNGHVIGKVIDGDENIWTLQDAFRCFMCEIHVNDKHVYLRIHVRHEDITKYMALERRDGKWVVITAGEHCKKLREMRNSPT